MNAREGAALSVVGTRLAPNRYVVLLLGALDASTYLIYVLGLSEEVFYLTTLIVKASLLLFYRRRTKDGLFVSRLAIFGIILLSISYSAAFAGWNRQDSQGIGFILHAYCTCYMVDRENFRTYFSAAANTILAFAILYYFSYARGGIPIGFGRAMFLEDYQPNLGGEIFCAGVFASFVSQRLWMNAVSCALFLPAVYLLEARSALISIGLMITTKLVFAVRRSRAGLFALIPLLAAIVSAVVINYDSIESVVSQVLLFGDINRGIGSGFTGRMERWAFGFNAFLDAPLFGQGYGFYYDKPDITAHSFIIYLLALFGMVGIFILGLYVFLAVTLFRNDRELGTLVLGFSFLTIFNDRVFNLNPYPFYLHVILLTVPVLTPWIRTASSRRPAHRNRPYSNRHFGES